MIQMQLNCKTSFRQHTCSKFRAQVHQIVAARSNPNISRLLVLYLLQAQTCDQHLAILFLHAQADWTKAIA